MPKIAHDGHDGTTSWIPTQEVVDSLVDEIRIWRLRLDDSISLHGERTPPWPYVLQQMIDSEPDSLLIPERSQLSVTHTLHVSPCDEKHQCYES